MTDDFLIKKILYNLKLEDKNTLVLGYESPLELQFKNNRYAIGIFTVRKTGGKKHNNEARRIQINEIYKEIFIEKSSDDICCAIIGYDNDTDTFTAWEIFKNLYSEIKNWNKSKSLYTNINYLNKANEVGADITPINLQLTDDSPAISFRSQYLANYLQNISNKEVKYKGNFCNLISLDKIHNRSYSEQFILDIQNFNSGIFTNSRNKKVKENNWTLEEFIIVLVLYLKIKNKETNNNQNNKDFIETQKLLNLISKRNNTTERSLSTISNRVANFKSKDPEWTDGEGLSGADNNPYMIYVAKKYLNNTELLNKDFNKIILKYSDTEQKNNYRIYNREFNDIDKQISKIINNITDPLEIQNLIDKKKKLHEKIVNILAKKLKNDFTVYEDPKGFDLYAYNKDSELSYLFEVKTIENNNFISQTRSAIIQLSEYEFMNKYFYSNNIFQNTIKKIIVFSQNPEILDDYKKYYKYLQFIEKLHIDFLFFNGEDIDFNIAIK